MPKDYVKAHIANQKAKGLKELRRLWVYPEDEAQIRKFVEHLRFAKEEEDRQKLTTRALQRKRKEKSE